MKTRTNRTLAGLTALGLGAALLASPAPAEACGGFFCSSSPVDQEAERILFVKEGKDVTAYVEIRYQGDPQDFAWVVPVPTVPTLGTWHGVAFNALDQVTQPQFIFDNCFAPEGDFAGAAGGAPAPPPADADNDGVIVHAQERVGPFDTATIESKDHKALVKWLRDNGYRIVDAMEPFIEIYTGEGMKFVALKLAPGEGVDAIDPIKMTYEADRAGVPLRLTSLAAVPEMGVKVFILGDRRFGPANVPEIEILDDEILFDRNSGKTNYPHLVARKVDAKGGHGFVTELASSTEEFAEAIANSGVPGGIEGAEEARDELAALLRKHKYITRLYTRVSPEEMDIDPMFKATGGDDVDRVHDLSDREVECGERDPVDRCEFSACGAGGQCAEPYIRPSSGQPGEYQQQGQALGCACAVGAGARAMMDDTAPGNVRVSCVDLRLNFMPLDNEPIDLRDGPPIFSNPCADDPCGASGECVDLNGTAVCRCEEGFVGVPTVAWDPETGTQRVRPTCVPPLVPIAPAFYTIELREPNLPYPGRASALLADEEVIAGGPTGGTPNGQGSNDDGGCSAVGGTAPAGLLALLLVIPALRRRRGSEG